MRKIQLIFNILLVSLFIFSSGCKKSGDAFSFVNDSTNPQDGQGAPSIINSTPSSTSVVQCVSDNVRCGTSPSLTNGSSQDYSISVTGAAPLTFEWRLDGTIISGAATASYTLIASPASIVPGTYTLTVNVSNSEGSDTHSWTVKINEPPEIGTSTPTNSSTIGVYYASLLSLDQLAADANSDAITYVWQLDGATTGTLTGSAITGGSRGVYSPTSAHAGNHVIKVIARDAHYNDSGAGKYEPEEYTWNVNVNYFSTKCNELDPGGICTVVGRPGLMTDTDTTPDGLYSATTEPIKIKPNYITNDGSGNLFISDSDSHVVWFHNRSGSAVSRLGRTIAAGKVRILVGNGSAGKTTDSSTSYTYERYKLNGPQAMYYDSVGDYLYIADYYNHRVVRVGGNGQGLTVFGNQSIATNNSTTNADNILATAHVCAYPVGLVVNAAKDTMFVSCTGNGSNNLSAIKQVNMTNPDPTLWTAKIAVGRTTTAGVIQNGSNGGITAYGADPRAGLTGNSATDVITDTGHTYAENDLVHLLSLTGGAGLTAGTATAYYIKNAVAGTSYQLSATAGGAAINFTSNITAGTIAKPTYTTITGNNATDVITHAGHPYVDNEAVVFTGLVGGAGLTVGTVYYIRNSVAGTSYQLATAPDGAAINFTTNITAAGLITCPASVQYPWALAFDQYENLYWTENNSTGRLRVLRRNASPASYFNGTLSAGAMNTAFTLLGGNGDSPSNATDVARASATWRDARGLAILTNGASIDGFFLSQSLRHMVTFINNSAGTLTYGGNSITTAAPVGIVWGAYNDPDYAGTTTPATNNRLFGPSGAIIDTTNNLLLVADTLNFQVRSLNLTTGAVATVTGGMASKHRARSESVSAEAAPDTELYLADQLLYDDSGSNNRLLIADNATVGANWSQHELQPTQTTATYNPSYRIRSLDLNTGLISTLVGSGYGNADNSPQSPSAATIQGLRGMSMTTDGSLLYIDRYQFGGGGNRNCQVRAYNLTGTSQTYFGVNAIANVITTLAGNYTTGCASASGAGTGLTNGIFYPEGISVSGTDLYISEYNRHCILKLDSSNNLTSAIGLCGTAGDVSGTLAAARLRYPKQLLQDPRFPTNFFVLDQTDQSTAAVKYVNISGADCDAGASHPCEVGGTAVLDGRIFSVFSVNGGYASALAYYKDPVTLNDDMICYASGESHNNTVFIFGNTGYGANNVICKYRVSGAQSLRVGSVDGAILTGGSQIDSESEGITAVAGVLSVTLNGPAGLAFDTEGNLFISEKNSHVIRKVKRWW